MSKSRLSGMPRKIRTPVPQEVRNKLLVYCKHECCVCNARIGRNEIHHINGDPSDNREENLVPLCPNCHSQADDGLFKEKELLMYKEAKIKKVGIKALLEQKEIPPKKFTDLFSMKLDELTKSLEALERRPYISEVNDKIDELIMLLKERIEKWDVPSVRYGTRELFLKLYKYSREEKIRTNLYAIFKDLFRFAYSQRKHILGNMILVFYFIWLKTWTSDYDIDKAEKCCDILLRLGSDFLDKDLIIAKDCLNQIDNAAGDMFEPEILSREIIFGAIVAKKKNENKEMNEFFKTIVNYIRWNDEYACDEGDFSYLLGGLDYAESIQNEYGVDIKELKKDYMLPIVQQHMNEKIDGYVGYLTSEEYDKTYREFEVEELVKLILSFERINPKVSDEINERIKKAKNKDLEREFNEIIRQNNFLRKVFRGSKMITTLKELINFLKESSDLSNLGVGITTYGPSWIDFQSKLNDRDKEDLKKLAKKWKISDDSEFEIEDTRMSFLMDSIVYIEKKNRMERLILFLEDINKRFKVKSITTGISFYFR